MDERTQILLEAAKVAFLVIHESAQEADSGYLAMLATQLAEAIAAFDAEDLEGN